MCFNQQYQRQSELLYILGILNLGKEKQKSVSDIEFNKRKSVSEIEFNYYFKRIYPRPWRHFTEIRKFFK